MSVTLLFIYLVYVLTVMSNITIFFNLFYNDLNELKILF